ncbi:hypothetical protein [Methylobacterium sp. D54C]
MPSRSELQAARRAPNRAARIRALAELMREHGGGLSEGLTEAVAYAAGFTRAEIAVYRDPACALFGHALQRALTPAGEHAVGRALVQEAQAKRCRMEDCSGDGGAT